MLTWIDLAWVWDLRTWLYLGDKGVLYNSTCTGTEWVSWVLMEEIVYIYISIYPYISTYPYTHTYTTHLQLFFNTRNVSLPRSRISLRARSRTVQTTCWWLPGNQSIPDVRPFFPLPLRRRRRLRCHILSHRRASCITQETGGRKHQNIFRQLEGNTKIRRDIARWVSSSSSSSSSPIIFSWRRDLSLFFLCYFSRLSFHSLLFVDSPRLYSHPPVINKRRGCVRLRVIIVCHNITLIIT